jgi:hypothetical protein
MQLYLKRSCAGQIDIILIVIFVLEKMGAPEGFMQSTALSTMA